VKPKTNIPKQHSPFRSWLLVGSALFLLGSATARAGVIIIGQSVFAAAGSSGNSLDIDLTNSGPSAITIAGVSFGISIGNPNISFTDANILTAAPYIFGANSLFGPDLTGPTSGQSLSSSDVISIPLSGITLSSGATMGLGHIIFNVAGTATAGAFPVSFAPFPISSLSDPAGNGISINTFSNGQITITAAAVPEPSSRLPLLTGIVLVAGASVKRKLLRCT
jgi:hypothetical protein